MIAFSFPGRAAALIALAAALASCGGGGMSTAPGVTTMNATSVRYGTITTINVQGRNLRAGGVDLRIDGGECFGLARTGTGSEEAMQFTCGMETVGEIRFHAVDGNGISLARLTLQVPTPQVTVVTNKGTFVLELDPRAAPDTSLNFLAYMRSGFYTSVLFHRVIADKLIQAGGYTAGPVVKAPTRDAIPLESNNGLKNLRGTLGMARGEEPNSARAQWYINVGDNPEFDYVSAESPGYAVFGKVVSGLDVVDTISAVATGFELTLQLTDFPHENVTITSMTQTR